MFKSMTAYGRASYISTIGRLTAEIQCVNRKHLEVQTFLPKEFLRFDAEVKKLVASFIGRGQINVRINVAFDKESPLVIQPNLPLARQIKSAWQAIADDLKISLNDDALLRVLSSQNEILLREEDLLDEDAYLNAIREVMHLALLQVKAMKIKEGLALYHDIENRFLSLAPKIEEIAIKSPTATGKYREKLLEKIQEVIDPSTELDDRILREVCVFAEKIDITEELTRFRSHLIQVKDQIASASSQDTLGVAKPLEFLVQELNREINTISAKSSDTDVTRLVIQIKTELERIREQIQNIE